MLNAVCLSSNLKLFAYAARRTLSSGQLYINVFCEIVLENRKLLDFGLRHVKFQRLAQPPQNHSFVQ